VDYSLTFDFDQILDRTEKCQLNTRAGQDVGLSGLGLEIGTGTSDLDIDYRQVW
jgi:hypothetical protein